VASTGNESHERAQRRKGDLTPASLYGRADQLEMSAAAIRELIALHGKRTG